MFHNAEMKNNSFHSVDQGQVVNFNRNPESIKVRQFPIPGLVVVMIMCWVVVIASALAIYSVVSNGG